MRNWHDPEIDRHSNQDLKQGVLWPSQKATEVMIGLKAGLFVEKLVETESFTLMKRLERNHKGSLNREAYNKKFNAECDEFKFISGEHLVKGYQLYKGSQPQGWFGNLL